MSTPVLGVAQPVAVWPAKAVRIVVPTSPGGGTDIVTRILAQKLSESFSQSFVVENRPGAGQILGTEFVARAPPDGYTLLMAASAIVLNQVLAKKPPYDTLRDFAPITLAASLPNVLTVHPSLPVKTVKELIALARAKPGALNYSSAGAGTSPHMSMELFRSLAGIDLVHIAYKGTGPATADLIAGHVQLSMPNTLTATPFLRVGKLRALGVTGSKRASALPNVPTLAEAGVPGYEAIQWYGLFAPAGTAREIVARVQADVAKALRLPDVGERLAADGAEAVGNRPDEFAAYIRSELEKWGRVVREAKLSLE
ncbi:MAG: tripartite tricarboxylate transporter substrate binding protein [Proteobacteria bacterium]|nr:tripartite tricarboxylate transporter substrate binding protein [Burkholderiales bacterium]